MKLILIHAGHIARNHLKQLLNNLDHIVVAESDHPHRLLTDIARHQPDAIIAGKLGSAFTDGTFPPLQGTIVLVPVIRLPVGASDDMLISLLVECLEKVRIEHQSRSTRPYSTDEQRLVLMDDRYQKYAQKERLGSDLSDDFDREKEIFIRQVHCARKNHSAAKRYLSQLLKTDRGLRVEVAYRVVHASYKVYWLRDHALRWASVLGHYIEGIQLEYLPSSASPSPQLDFLHYEAPPESLYAAAALVGHGISSSLESAFCSILTKKYTGQSKDALLTEALNLSGWCALLREVAIAQVQIMGQILDTESDWHSGLKSKRRIHRAEGIFNDWWGLPTMRRHPDKMRDLAYLIVKDWLSPAATSSAVAPYRAFVEALSLKATAADKNEEDV